MRPQNAETDRSAADRCVLCKLADFERHGTRNTSGDLLVAYVDEGAMVLLRPDVDGALVAPRCHVDGVSELIGDDLSTFLALLRRTANAVETLAGGSSPSVEPWQGGPKEDHVSFRVTSDFAAGRERSVTDAKMEDQADQLKRLLEASLA